MNMTSWHLACAGALLLVTLTAEPDLLRAAPAKAPRPSPSIQEINIVHFSHTDVGFTDSPSVCRELYRRYLDIAVDTILDTMSDSEPSHFCWTAEATMPVYDWWQAAATRPARAVPEGGASRSTGHYGTSVQ